jgi:type I restriction-modification system DNA methylase subunit
VNITIQLWDDEQTRKAVEIRDIVDNDYNLNVTLYVMPIEKTEEIDLAKELSELKELEKENSRLKKLVADITLDNAILKEAARGNF